MAAPTIIIDNLENGQDLNLPYEVTGQAIGNGSNVCAMAWQIDDQDLRDMSPNAPATPVPFEFSISQSDCPSPGTWYLLSIYAWEDAAGEVSVESRTFRQAPVSGGGGGGFDSGGGGSGGGG